MVNIVFGSWSEICVGGLNCSVLLVYDYVVVDWFLVIVDCIGVIRFEVCLVILDWEWIVIL